MTRSQLVLLILRVTLECAVVAALAWWGWHQRTHPGGHVVWAIVAPIVGFGVWGSVDFRQARRLAEPLRLAEELAIGGLAAVALFSVGRHTAAGALVALSLVYHVAVYASGARLLKVGGSRQAAVRLSGRSTRTCEQPAQTWRSTS